ncbi:MAG: FMN-binding glutamate synthase family protein, partial [Alphaproteobacteria bacterium]|nr:FMN-binding glutamate synthase family protein [Alphaproteobacteria bacterium]
DLVFQIGTAKYGVGDNKGQLSDKRLIEISAHDQVRMFEIKLSQGAKPGKGGILPGIKVTEEIARIRGIEPGSDSLSPNRDPDLETIDDILDRIAHIRTVTGKPVGFKTVIGSKGWLVRLFEACLDRGIDSAPDFITIDGAEGGSGAAPMGLIDYMGLPIHESLPLVVDMLVRLGLKDRVKVIASGKLITPPDIIWAFCIGADAVVSARGFMFSLGCIQAQQCDKDTCPTGITTHNPRLQRGLVVEEKAQLVANYVRNINKGIRLICHSCGVHEPSELDRNHCRIVMPNGRSVPLDEIYPIQLPATEE